MQEKTARVVSSILLAGAILKTAVILAQEIGLILGWHTSNI